MDSFKKNKWVAASWVDQLNKLTRNIVKLSQEKKKKKKTFKM